MVEALFFQTYYAYLMGDLEKTQMFYALLKEEFNTRKDRGALNYYQFKELKNIRTALETGVIPKNTWINETSIPEIQEKNHGIKQTDLVKRLHYEAIGTLKDCLKSDDSLCLYNIEHPCGTYGRVDMVYMDSSIVYPTEIKPLEGRHDILGQISKYTLYFKLLLHVKHFKSVQPVTICNSYDKHTLIELKRMSVITLRYSISKGRVIVGAL